MSRGTPFHIINRFWLADAVRVTKERIAGACISLKNLIPKIGGGERVRTGYKAYTDVTIPTGTQILKVAPIQTPSQEDVHLSFTDSGGQKVYINPWWNSAGIKQTTNLQINETKTFLPTGGTLAGTGGLGANQIRFNNAGSLGLSAINDYYKNWRMSELIAGLPYVVKTAFVTAYTYDSGGDTALFTTVEDLDIPNGLNFPVSTFSYTLYRHFHDNHGFTPAYNNDLANPPTLNSENSILRFSGGQGSVNGNRGIWANPYLNRTYFPSVPGRSFTYRGTYISERELGNYTTIFPRGFVSDLRFIASSSTFPPLQSDRTYWIAIAPVYDGFQIGKLRKYEASNDYTTQIGGVTNNYVESGTNARISITIFVKTGFLNKRVTGVNIYIAQDAGNTEPASTDTPGRKSPYFFVGHLSFIDTDLSWSYDDDALTQEFRRNFRIDANIFLARGNAYIEDAGILETPPDIMYAYSTEEIVGIHRFLANCYVSSESAIDRQNVFTNPEQGNATIGNVGILAPDLFSNEEPTYRLRVQPTIGSKINAIIQTGIDEITVLKDRGILLGRILMLDTQPEITWTVIDEYAGTTTPNAWFKDDEDRIYFPSYTDVYRYRNGNLEKLIERIDKNDWLDSYRQSISYTEKENACCFWLQELRCGIFCFGNNRSTATGYSAMQYLLSPEFGWRELRFKPVADNSIKAQQSFKYIAKLRNGDTIASTNDSIVEFKQFTWDRSVDPPQLIFNDDGVGIIPHLRTGNFIVASQPTQRYGDESKDFVFQHFFLNRDLDIVTTGNLDIKLRDELGNAYVRSNMTKAVERLPFFCIPDQEPKIYLTMDIEYNASTNPERLQGAGKSLSIDSIELFGISIPRLTRVIDEITQEVLLCEVGVGTISGKFEFLIVNPNTWETFTFDTPFTTTYSSVNGNTTEPTWRFGIHTARTGSGVDVAQADILIQNRTLTSFQARSPEPNTLVMYGIIKT